MTGALTHSHIYTNLGLLINYDKFMAQFGAVPQMTDPTSLYPKSGVIDASPLIDAPGPQLVHPPGTFQRLLAMISSNAAKKSEMERLASVGRTPPIGQGGSSCSPSPPLDRCAQQGLGAKSFEVYATGCAGQGAGNGDDGCVGVSADHHRSSSIASLRLRAQQYELNLQLAKTMQEFIR